MSSARKRTEAVLSRAIERSDALLQLLPQEHTGRRTTAGRIVEICRDLVGGKPAENPLAKTISDVGVSRYGKFPAGQSLYNNYREFLAVWREAFTEAVGQSAANTGGGRWGAPVGADELSNLDAGTRARILYREQLLKELKLANDRLTHIIRQTVPVPNSRHVSDASKSSQTPNSAIIVRGWIELLSATEGPLELVSAGIQVGRHCRPGRVIMPSPVLAAMRELCGLPAHDVIEG